MFSIGVKGETDQTCLLYYPNNIRARLEEVARQLFLRVSELPVSWPLIEVFSKQVWH